MFCLRNKKKLSKISPLIWIAHSITIQYDITDDLLSSKYILIFHEHVFDDATLVDHTGGEIVGLDLRPY